MKTAAIPHDVALAVGEARAVRMRTAALCSIIGDGERTSQKTCSIPSEDKTAYKQQKALRAVAAKGFLKDVGSGLLSHMTLCSIIGDGELNFQVRNGIGCTLSSMATNKVVKIYN